MILTNRIRGAGLGVCLLSVSLSGCNSADKPSATPSVSAYRAMLEIDPPDPVDVVLEMSDFLRASTRVSFRAVLDYDDVQSNGRKLQYGGTSQVWMRRPDRLHTNYRGDERTTRTYFNGTTFTAFDVENDLYAVSEVGPDIDNALDFIFDTYGITIPIADFVYADPFEALMTGSTDGIWVGLHEVNGKMCHHLAFAKDTIDWQIWIEEGARPVPHKILITYKDEEGSPQWSARFLEWDLNAVVPESMFVFEAPEGANEMDFLPISSLENDE